MRLEYWIAARIGEISMRLTGRKPDTVKLVQNCQHISAGKPLPGADLHDTQRFSCFMWVRGMFAGVILLIATGAVGAALDQFTHSLRHDVAGVATVWVGLTALSGGEVVVLFIRMTCTYRSLGKDAPRSYARPLTKSHGLPRPYDFWIGAFVSMGFFALLLATNGGH